ncbi:MAG: radical SAM protein [Patescibacteria group bacterium]|nr:radical SAM protein [Patescibacteria group bacterium]
MASKTVISKFKLAFPGERVAVKAIQGKINFSGTQALDWVKETDIFKDGDIYCAEFSPTFRCSEACPGCPDSVLILARNIKAGLVPAQEDRATPEQMLKRVDLLADLGVKHVMMIGGTIDREPELVHQVDQALEKDLIVSWFTDGILLTEQNDGGPNELFRHHLGNGWLSRISTHLSMDYVSETNFLEETCKLPSKGGRLTQFAIDGEQSRRFKSQYGARAAKNLIDAKVARVFINMTVSSHNVDQFLAIYDQVKTLQNYALDSGSLTQVLMTFSPWTWRPHQARGDDLQDCQTSSGLQVESAARFSDALGQILELEYERIDAGKSRLLANSSGFINFFVDSQYRELVVKQELLYPGGRPEMIQVMPNGDVKMDPMFWGPELVSVNNIFGYRDRDPRPDHNPFVQFQPQNKPWFPNLVALPVDVGGING